MKSRRLPLDEQRARENLLPRYENLEPGDFQVNSIAEMRDEMPRRADEYAPSGREQYMEHMGLAALQPDPGVNVIDLLPNVAEYFASYF